MTSVEESREKWKRVFGTALPATCGEACREALLFAGAEEARLRRLITIEESRQRRAEEQE